MLHSSRKTLVNTADSSVSQGLDQASRRLQHPPFQVSHFLARCLPPSRNSRCAKTLVSPKKKVPSRRRAADQKCETFLAQQSVHLSTDRTLDLRKSSLDNKAGILQLAAETEVQVELMGGRQGRHLLVAALLQVALQLDH